jgi:CubicO group peptidase (beta-lactamase class C family)
MKRTACLLLLLAPMLWAADVLPATPNGRLVREYLDAFNQGEAAMRAYMDKTPGPPTEERLARYRAMKADLGSLSPVRFVGEDAGSLRVVVQAADGRTLLLAAVISPQGRIAGLRLDLAADDEKPQASQGPPEPEPSVLSEIKALVEQQSKAGDFSGTVLLARGSAVLWQAAYGWANAEKKILNQDDTRFDVGSIAKGFTRVAIGQLLDQGRIKLSDKVGKFLPDYPNATVREQVTIAQLLDMRSGIGDFFGEKFAQAPKEKIRALQDYLPFFATDPLLFPPGTQQRYSNGGYIVLGLVIEAVSGRSYYDYVQQNIFAPAGMKDSSFGLRGSGDAKQAIGYTSEPGPGASSARERHPNLALLPARGSSAGSAQATAMDLFRFSQVLATGKLVSRESLDKVDMEPDEMGIAGGAPGLNAALETGVEGASQASYAVVVLSNFDPPSAEKLSQQIRGLLHRAN